MNPESAVASDTVEALLTARAVHPVFQPIVELDTGATVGFEALARGPEGSALESPGAMFAAAVAEGRLAELDQLCRDRALEAALEERLPASSSLFVNVEPSTLRGTAPFTDPRAIVAGSTRVIVELTERELAARPADVLGVIRWLRGRGCGIALDDVGIDERSLALLPFVEPDVIKLDMGLLHERSTSTASARVLNAVAAEAERSGALVLAEGIETADHLRRARAVGATLGQGWFLGRPAPLASLLDREGAPPAGLAVPARQQPDVSGTPFELVAGRRATRRGDKRLLLALSKQLEAEALGLGPEAVVISSFQDAGFFTPASRRRYQELAANASLVAAIGVGMPLVPAPGVRGAEIAPDAPLRGEWDVAVLGPHFAGAFVARDRGGRLPDLDREFDFFLTYDRGLVQQAAMSLLALLAPTS